MPTHYETLGVWHGASLDAVRSSYKKLALEHHPDKTQALPLRERNRREELFKNISQAYEVLSDSKKRTQYDKELLSSRITNAQASAFTDKQSWKRPTPPSKTAHKMHEQHAHTPPRPIRGSYTSSNPMNQAPPGWRYARPHPMGGVPRPRRWFPSPNNSTYEDPPSSRPSASSSVPKGTSRRPTFLFPSTAMHGNHDWRFGAEDDVPSATFSESPFTSSVVLEGFELSVTIPKRFRAGRQHTETRIFFFENGKACHISHTMTRQIFVLSGREPIQIAVQETPEKLVKVVIDFEQSGHDAQLNTTIYTRRGRISPYMHKGWKVDFGTEEADYIPVKDREAIGCSKTMTVHVEDGASDVQFRYTVKPKRH